MYFNEWSKQEISNLKKFYPIMLVRDLIPLFPKRNRYTIAAKALALGLPSAKLWREEQNKLLKNNFATSSKEELLKLFPKRTWTAIMAQGERLGIKRNRNKPRISINENYFNKWSPNMAYVLGFILSDGCITKGTYTGYSDALKFGVQLKDKDILEKIKKELKSEHAISIVRNAAHFCITSQKIVDSLKHLGITYRKSLEETVPKVPKKYIKYFIRGLIDGDGGISINSKNYPTLRFYGGINPVTFVRNYFWKNFNAFSSIGKKPSKLASKNYLCYIAYRTNTAKRLINFLYKDAEIFLNRKYKLAMKCVQLNFRKKNNRTATYE